MPAQHSPPTASVSGRLRQHVRNEQSAASPRRPDRRNARTRDALLSAFGMLLSETAYDRIAIGQIVDRANVGRSTFYEHFSGKDDLLEQSVAEILAVLAACVTPDASLDRVTDLFEHFWTMRRPASELLNGAARRVVSGALAGRIDEHFPASGSGPTPHVRPLTHRLSAAYLAEAQLGLIAAWIAQPDGRTPRDLAHALVTSTRAAVSALATTAPKSR